MKRNPSCLAHIAASAAILVLVTACGSSSTSASAPVTPQAVKGVTTPSQFSVVTAK